MVYMIVYYMIVRIPPMSIYEFYSVADIIAIYKKTELKNSVMLLWSLILCTSYHCTLGGRGRGCTLLGLMFFTLFLLK